MSWALSLNSRIDMDHQLLDRDNLPARCQRAVAAEIADAIAGRGPNTSPSGCRAGTVLAAAVGYPLTGPEK